MHQAESPFQGDLVFCSWPNPGLRPGLTESALQAEKTVTQACGLG
jgi:hypothetical protein